MGFQPADHDDDDDELDVEADETNGNGQSKTSPFNIPPMQGGFNYRMSCLVLVLFSVQFSFDPHNKFPWTSCKVEE